MGPAGVPNVSMLEDQSMCTVMPRCLFSTAVRNFGSKGAMRGCDWGPWVVRMLGGGVRRSEERGCTGVGLSYLQVFPHAAES